jgi:hypothetical protein
MELPETRYAAAGDGVHIAYQIVSDGPLDLVVLTEWASHVRAAWEMPWMAKVYRRLASFSRLILFDRRGTGIPANVDGHLVSVFLAGRSGVRTADRLAAGRSARLGMIASSPLSRGSTRQSRRLDGIGAKTRTYQTSPSRWLWPESRRTMRACAASRTSGQGWCACSASSLCMS